MADEDRDYCWACQGTGRTDRGVCRFCDGTGRVQ